MGNHIDELEFIWNKDLRVEIIRKLQNDRKPVVIFGAGKFGRTQAECLMKNKIQVLCFLVDDEYWEPQKKIRMNGGYEIDCMNSTQLKSIEVAYNMLVGIIDYSRIIRLKEEYPNCSYIEYLDVQATHIMGIDYLKRHEPELTELYNVLQDVESKEVLKRYLYARCTGDVECISKVVHDNKYLYDWELLNISKNDIIIDGGAFEGDSVYEIEDYLKGALPKKIFAFEPDQGNYMRLVTNMSGERYQVVKCVNEGLHEKDDELKFSATGAMDAKISNLSEGTVIKVSSLDAHEEYNNVSVIKMDIEGSEIFALKGCKELLATKHPRLAICVYHRSEDLLDIYQFLKQYNYLFYLRQHSASVEETVLYAI